MQKEVTISLFEKREVVVPVFEKDIPFQEDWNDETKLCWFSYQKVKDLPYFLSAISVNKDMTWKPEKVKKTVASLEIQNTTLTAEERRLRAYRIFIELGLFDLLTNERTAELISIGQNKLEKRRNRKLTNEELEKLYISILEKRLQTEPLHDIIRTNKKETTEVEPEPYQLLLR